MLARIRGLAVVAALAVPLMLTATPAYAARPAAPGGAKTASAAASQVVTTKSASINCNNNINVNWTSPNPRVVNWTATESCNTVIGAIAIIASTLYYDTGGHSYVVAEGTHPTQSPAYSVYSTGSSSLGYGGSFHVQDTYQVLLAYGQGSWPLPSNCFYYAGTISLQCTASSAEFTLAGNPTINAGGVVNGTDYSANDIHPGTTIAIFGQWFAPADTVIVTDSAGYQYTIRSGSPWWYDSTGQINATLPTSVHTGYATVAVATANGLLSGAAPITIR